MSADEEIINTNENSQEVENVPEVVSEGANLANVAGNEASQPVILPAGFSGDMYDSNYDDAVQFYSQDKFDELNEICSRVDPAEKNEKYVALRGNCLYKQGNQEAAVSKWKKAVTINPSFAEPYINLGNVEYAKKNVENAIKFWITASSIKPENITVNINLGVAYGEKGLRYESLKYFDKYLKYAPETNTQKYNEISSTMNYFMDTAKAAIESAEEHVRSGKINKAVQYYMYAIENYPMQVKAPYSLGNIFYNDTNYEKALYYWDLCRKAPKIPPQLMLNIAKAYDRLKLYDSAYCFYNRYLPFIASNPNEYNVVKSRLIQLSVAFSKNPLVAEAHLTMAEKAEEQADYFKAIEEYENYIILAHKDDDIIQKKILQLKMFYHPESYLVGLLINKIESMKENEIGELIIPMCNRIMLFAEPNSKEFMYAQTKKNSIIRRGV